MEITEIRSGGCFGQTLQTRFGLYEHGQLSLRLIDRDGEPRVTATCPVVERLAAGCVAVKVWAENEGLDLVLIRGGVIAGGAVAFASAAIGSLTAPVYRLTPTAQQEAVMAQRIGRCRSVYEGDIVDGEHVALVDGRPLPLRLDLRSHSPTGFAWGYGGLGPAQLALAILADHCGSNEMRALHHYQSFKFRVVGRLAQNERWTLSSAQIEAALRSLERGAQSVVLKRGAL
jgi:hypothetical protein